MLKVVRNLICSACLLFALSILVFSNNSASADTVDYIVNVAPSFNITLSANNVTLDLNPNTKTSDAKDLNIKVSTNNMTGYYLTMSSTGDTTDLVRDNTADGKNAVIPTLSAAAGATASTLTDNTWGYKQESGNFIPYVSGVKLLENKHATNEDETTLSFGAKINYSQAAGSYELGLVLTGVANPMMNYMQDLNPTLCTTEPQTVLDNRDNQEYIIQRLADGNCWMMTNLNLGAVELEEDLTSDNTNLATTVPASTFNDWNRTTIGTGTNSLTSGEYITLTGTDSTAQAPYGTLYNYFAASAGTMSGSTSSKNTEYDICPAGWRLPIGGSGGEYDNLYKQSAYNTNAKMRAPVANGGAAFTLSGNFNNTAPISRDSIGYYWTSTWYSNMPSYPYMYELDLTTSGVTPVSYSGRYNGMSIRCVLNETMQDFTNSNVTAMTTNSTRFLSDSRDGQIYSVTKFSNGSVWMTRDIAIGCAGVGTNYSASYSQKTLTSADTNLTADYTTPNTNGWNNYTTAYQQCDATYGGWYNYKAVTAGTISGNSNTVDATEDICPKGWQLPTYEAADSIIGVVGSSGSLLRPTDAGYYAYDGSRSRDGKSWWWLTKANGDQLRYNLVANSSSVAFNSSNYRPAERITRCVFKDNRSLSNITNMQDISSDIVANTADGATATLRDIRDNQEYTVAKINGNIWMTKNLAIGCNGATKTSIQLTSADSNIATTWPSSSSVIAALSTDDYNTPRMECSANSNYGAWYNYAAASAGTITGSSNSNNGVYDICPQGWRLPTNTELGTIGSSGYNAFNPAGGGTYRGGSNVGGADMSYTWSSTSLSTTSRYGYYRQSNGSGYVDDRAGYMYRSYGEYIRCIAK